MICFFFHSRVFSAFGISLEELLFRKVDPKQEKVEVKIEIEDTFPIWSESGFEGKLENVKLIISHTHAISQHSFYSKRFFFAAGCSLRQLRNHFWQNFFFALLTPFPNYLHEVLK